MLFLGSKTFPTPGSLERHISDYFGYANAYTSEEKTSYYFESSCEGFRNGTEIFSKMFYEPSFDMKYIKKELNSINSEHEKNINSDSRKLYYIMKDISNPNHPFQSNFGTGNKETLGILDETNLMQSLLTYFNTYYFAANMKLVIYENANIDSIISHVEKRFKNLKVKDLDEFRFSLNQSKLFIEKPFTKDYLVLIIII